MAIGTTTPLIGAGTVAAFGNTGAFARWTSAVEVTSISIDGPPKDIDTTVLETTVPAADEFGGRKSIPGKLNDIEINMTVHYDPNYGIPCVGAPDSLTITLPDANNTVWSGDVLLDNIQINLPVEDKSTADLVLRGTGLWTWDDGVP